MTTETATTNSCPSSMSGDHKYFIYKTFETYEPATGYLYAENDKDHRTLYDKVEFAILGCNCGSVIKSRITSDVAA
jgi:hypothetical protein